MIFFFGKEEGDEKCQLAYDMYIDRLRKYIAQYFAVLNGADAIVFTAGIGENSSVVREDIISGMTWFGVDTDRLRMCQEPMALFQQIKRV